MIKTLLQETLDNALIPKNIYSYDQRKTGNNANEYIVYSVSGEVKDSFADNINLVKHTNITVRYYYNAELLGDFESRKQIRENEKLIEQALEEQGFYMPFGKFDGGDIDDIGYLVTIFECEFWEVL
jgi:predicted TIM-barrel fold metal-dependent hydrolase